jgi:hypothetical protein
MAGRILLINALAISLLFAGCANDNAFLKDFSEIPHYPSASGIEYYNNHFYVMGDDAANLVVLDSTMQVTDSISFFHSEELRIPKDKKQDLEAMTLINDSNVVKIMLIGSGSMPTRCNMQLLDPLTKQHSQYNIDTFYKRVRNLGLKELNIEGAATIGRTLVLAARGHKGFPRNYLLFTTTDFWKQQGNAPIKLVRVGYDTDTTIFRGVSGLAYSAKTGQLFLSVSTEDTKSTHEDGAIGKSYIWVIDEVLAKRNWTSMNPNREIDLEAIDSKFRGQKIESLCITGSTRHFLQLALVADNDDGKSVIFRMDVSKK